MTTTWEYPSASSDAIYIVTHAANGLLACTCRGWQFKRPNKPRTCKHIDDVVAKHQLATEEQGGYVFSFGTLQAPSADALTSQADIDIIGKVETTMTTTMTTAFEGMKASAMTDAKFGHLLNEAGGVIAEKFDKAFGNGEWVMDEKLDGHRCQLLKVGDTVTTTLRSVPLPAQIVAAMRQLPFDAHLDGELAVPGGISTDVPNIAFRDQLQFLAFDVLSVCGESVLHLAQEERRQMLEVLAVHFTGPKVAVAVVAQYEPTFANVQAIWNRGGEGVILKRKTSTYRPGYRSGDWLKVKRLEQHTVTVTGFDAGSFGPTSVTRFKFDDGVEGRCKTRDTSFLTETAANPEAFIGRRLVIQCQQRIKGKSPRHPMFQGWEVDHVAGDSE